MVNKGCASGKEPACQCRRHKRGRFSPWVGKIPGEGNGNLLRYSCLENYMDRGAWQATVHCVAKRQALLRPAHPSTHTCTRGCCSLDNHATEEVPLRLKETGWSGSRGLSSSRLALPGERAQRPWPPRHAPSTTLTLTSSLPRSGGASTLPRWEPGPGRAIMLSSRELDSGT